MYGTYEYVLKVWKDETILKSMFGFMDYIKSGLTEMRPKISIRGGEFINQMNGYIFSIISAAFDVCLPCIVV